MSTVLAIDIGTKMGWALYVDGVFMNHGMADFTPKPGTKKRPDPHPGQRFIRMWDWLSGRHTCPTPDKVVYEQVSRHVGTRAAHVYGGFLGILQAWAAARGIPCEGIAVGTIKKYATGKGTASKAEMIEAASHIVGYIVVDDNEADAICLLATERRHGL